MFISFVRLRLPKLRRFTKRLQNKTINLLPNIIYNRVYVNCNESHLLPISKKIHLRHLSSIMPDGRSFLIAYEISKEQAIDKNENDDYDLDKTESLEQDCIEDFDKINFTSSKTDLDSSFALLCKVSPSVCKYIKSHSYCTAKITKKSMFML